MKLMLLSLSFAGAAATAPVLAQDWAMNGVDAVGFLQSGQPIPGRSDISTMWKGKVWHFATEENRSSFEADPRSFAPAFGGLCPVALADGRRVPGDPARPVVIGNRLYLTGSERSARTLTKTPDDILDRAADVWDR